MTFFAKNSLEIKQGQWKNVRNPEETFFSLSVCLSVCLKTPCSTKGKCATTKTTTDSVCATTTAAQTDGQSISSSAQTQALKFT